MTDETTTTPATGTAKEEPVLVAAAAVGDEYGTIAEGAVAIQGDAAIIVARFADPSAAAIVYDDLRAAERDREIGILGVLVVDEDAAGKVHIRKMTDHTTRNGAAWGAVAGVVLGVIFPPSILASAVGVGIAGAALGKVGNILKKSQLSEQLEAVLIPNSSGIVALVELTAVEAVKAEMPQAEAVATVPVDHDTAEAIEKAAATVEPAAASSGASSAS